MGGHGDIDWRGIRYGSCWEDPAVLAEALGPLHGARVLSIASAGDNAFMLAARGAAAVVAVDVSAAQLALCALKMAALRSLDHAGLVHFVGAVETPRDDAGRELVYRALRAELSAPARAFWDAHLPDLRRGIVHSGRLERYFQVFRSRVLPLVHGRRTVLAALQPRDVAERTAFHDERWDVWRWRLAVRLFFSGPLLGRLGRDPLMLRHAEGPVAERILRSTHRGFVELPPHHNPYLSYMLTGSFASCLPDWLQPGNHAAVRSGLDVVVLREGDVRDALTEGALFDAFNLSDLPEYLAKDEFDRLLGAVRASARPGARVAYWNLLVPRRRPEALRGAFAERDTQALHRKARAFFYQDLVLEVAR